jgi:hypothetical protein
VDRDGPSRECWLPVDPTFNQFPADATHLRLLQGGSSTSRQPSCRSSGSSS